MKVENPTLHILKSNAETLFTEKLFTGSPCNLQVFLIIAETYFDINHLPQTKCCNRCYYKLNSFYLAGFNCIGKLFDKVND